MFDKDFNAIVDKYFKNKWIKNIFFVIYIKEISACVYN